METSLIEKVSSDVPANLLIVRDNEYYKKIYEYAMSMLLPRVPKVPIKCKENVIDYLPLTFLQCFDIYKTFCDIESQHNLEPFIIPDKFEPYAKQFVQYVKFLNNYEINDNTKDGGTMRYSSMYEDFAAIIYLFDCYQINDKFKNLIMATCSYDHSVDYWQVAGGFLIFFNKYQIIRYDDLVSHHFNELIAKLQLVKIKNIPEIFFTTTKGRKILISKIKDQTSVNSFFGDISERIMNLTVDLTHKGIYDLISPFDWFNVSIPAIEGFLKMMKTKYPDWKPPKSMINAMTNKEKLIKSYDKENNKLFFVNEGTKTGGCSYILKLRPYEHVDIYLYTTDLFSYNCSLRVHFKFDRWENKNMLTIKPAFDIKKPLNICITVRTYDEKNNNFIILSDKMRHIFNKYYDCILEYAVNIEECEIIFHQIYYLSV